MSKGKLYGIGVGIGRFQTFNCKSGRNDSKCGYDYYTKNRKKKKTLLPIILQLPIFQKAEILPLVFQMVTDMEVVSKQWEENRRIIEEKLDEGKNLVFLTLGDPMLYSTYMYIFRALKRTEYTVETIPGIPAF